MSSNAIEAQGTLLKIGSGASPESYSTIAEIKTFTGPGGSATVIDVTDLSSTSKEKRMGLPDEGQLSFTINYIPNNTQHAALRADRASRVLRNFRIQFNDGSPASTWTFSGYVMGFSVSGAIDAVIEANVTIEISGSIVET